MSSKVLSNPNPDPDLVVLYGANKVVGLRFRKAFPELARCFAWLSRGVAGGTSWLLLVDSYARQITEGQAVRLVAEIHDVRVLARAAPNLSLDTLVTVLGWDLTTAPDEIPTSLELLQQLEEITAAVWEAALS
jgi:hypothetical protein